MKHFFIAIILYYMTTTTIKCDTIIQKENINSILNKNIKNELLILKKSNTKYITQTLQYYSNRNYQPIWSYYLEKSTNELEKFLLEFKKKSAYYGLNPINYNYYQIINNLNKYKKLKPEKNNELINSQLDVYLSIFYINLYNDILYGRTDPTKIFTSLYEYSTKNIDYIYPLRITNKLNLFKFKEFNNHYLNLLYKELVLKPYEKNKIIANIEFYKWHNRINITNTNNLYFIVNLAECYLYIKKQNKIIDKFKICIGKNSITEKDDSRSPMLNSKISHIIINPIWFIPKSIFINEVYEKTYKDTSFWTRTHIVMIDTNGQKIKLKDFKYKLEDLKKMTTLPFITYQLPYEGNSLGKYKFIFNNKHGIYLHDTDEKELFAISYRCFSHGCIRVQYPNLIFEILRKEKIISINQINYSNILKNKKSYAITLNFKIPLIIEYKTITFHKNKLEYHQDIYGFEKEVLKNM